MARIKSLKKSKRSFRKSFKKLRKRSSRKSIKKLRKRSFNKSRKSLKKKSRKMKVRTNRKIGGKKKQQMGGVLDGDDLQKLNLLLPPYDREFRRVFLGGGGGDLNTLLIEYGYTAETTAHDIETRNKEVAAKLMGLIQLDGNEKFGNLTTSELSIFIGICGNPFRRREFATGDLEKLTKPREDYLNGIIISSELSRPMFESINILYIGEYGFSASDEIAEVERVNTIIKSALNGLEGDATTVEELSDVLEKKIIGEGYDRKNYKKYGDDSEEGEMFTTLKTKVQDLRKFGNLLGISDGDPTLSKIKEFKGIYGFLGDDDLGSITQVNTIIKVALNGLEGDAKTVEELSAALGTLIGDEYKTGDYKEYSREDSDKKRKLDGIVQEKKRQIEEEGQRKIQEEKRAQDLIDFQDGQIQVYYAEIDRLDDFPGTIQTQITLKPKQTKKRSGLVGKRYITVENIGEGEISVSTLFGKELSTIPSITIQNFTSHELADGRYQKLVILPELVNGDVILYRSKGFFSKDKYGFASVTDKGGGRMKVHNGAGDETIPDIYVKIEGMASDQIKSSDDQAAAAADKKAQQDAARAAQQQDAARQQEAADAEKAKAAGAVAVPVNQVETAEAENAERAAAEKKAEQQRQEQQRQEGERRTVYINEGANQVRTIQAEQAETAQRITGVSPGTSTTSKSVSEALEKIKKALLQKREAGSDA